MRLEMPLREPSARGHLETGEGPALTPPALERAERLAGKDAKERRGSLGAIILPGSGVANDPISDASRDAFFERRPRGHGLWPSRRCHGPSSQKSFANTRLDLLPTPEMDVLRFMDNDPVIAARQPAKVTLEAGKAYFFCTCGRSSGQPFCDGSHKGTGFAPQKFVADKEGDAWLCQCKHTGNAPFCDGTHKTV